MNIASSSLLSIALSAAAFAQSAQSSAINKAMFEPVYRAAKTLQGSTSTGVNFTKYSELLQALSTEIAIVKDQRPEGDNAKLLALFDETLAHYEAAGVFWRAKVEGPTRGATRAVKGIPIYFEKNKSNDAALKLAERYELPVKKANAGGVLTSKLEYRWIPDDSPQRVWRHAEQSLAKATDLYYGR